MEIGEGPWVVSMPPSGASAHAALAVDCAAHSTPTATIHTARAPRPVIPVMLLPLLRRVPRCGCRLS
ncbi:hypothetical protein GCM10020227_24280 [Streptomyces flavovirens]